MLTKISKYTFVKLFSEKINSNYTMFNELDVTASLQVFLHPYKYFDLDEVSRYCTFNLDNTSTHNYHLFYYEAIFFEKNLLFEEQKEMVEEIKDI